MRFIILSLVWLALTGCSSMHRKVFSNIHEDDPSSKVIETLGQPDRFEPSRRIEGGTGWYYQDGAEVCAFTIHEDKVKYMACSTDPNYKNFRQRFAQGLYEGFSKPKQISHCTTREDYPGHYTSDCD